MSVRILVAPTSGITYTWNGCMGLYDGNHGDIVEAFDLDGDGRSDGLKIKWVLQTKSDYDFDSESFYFVRWSGANGGRGRQYIVPEEQMMELVNDYNQGGFARDALYHAPMKYDRAAGENPHRVRSALPVEGAPQLPAKWATLLITEPIVAK